MKYVKTVNPINADGRKRSLSVGYAISLTYAKNDNKVKAEEDLACSRSPSVSW